MCYMECSCDLRIESVDDDVRELSRIIWRLEEQLSNISLRLLALELRDNGSPNNKPTD